MKQPMVDQIRAQFSYIPRGSIIWNHRNRCVFDGTTPSIAEVLVLAWKQPCTGLGCLVGVGHLLICNRRECN